MSDTYTWPQRCPDLVQDVSLKRARIDNEDGTSTIRTTSSSSTDVTAITQALGNQADTISQPSVIGLLKNLVANSGGGGGGETSSYPVFKSELYQVIKQYQPNTTVLLSSLLPSGATIPEWTKYIVFFPFTVRTQGDKSFLNGPIIVNKTMEAPLCINVKTKTIDKEQLQYKIVSSDYFFLYVLQDNEPAIQYTNAVQSTITYPLSSGTSSNVTTSCVTSTNPAFIPLQIIFLDKDPLEITGGGGGSGQAVNTYSLTINGILANAIDTPINTPASTTDKTLATLGSFQKRYQSWYSSIVFTPDVAKSTADLPSGFQAALYQATEAEFTGSYFDVQVRAKFRLSPNSDETILANPVVCYNTDNGTYSHTRGFVLKLEKTSSTVTITMQRGTSIDFGNNDNTFNSYVDSTTTFNISYIQLKMTSF